jgi:hypothetical protein
MSEPKRYDPPNYIEDSGFMELATEGEFVRYEDYARMQAYAYSLKAERELRNTGIELVIDSNLRLQAEVERLTRLSLLKWIPSHKAEASIEHNRHLASYQKADEYYNDYDWVSPEEKKKAIEANDVWVLTWYPETPVGFCHVAASSVEALIDYATKEVQL